jgi:hypothetical protein
MNFVPTSYNMQKLTQMRQRPKSKQNLKTSCFKKHRKLHVAVHRYNPSLGKAEAGESQI